tara:strand:- start:2117 stop:2611 length:495 start_codon:yes stop_codon:yes gene_type:complete
MIYFWPKYNNISMDFSDFSEFIGPIIFGLIAWLSNYFGKKKKPSKNDPKIEKKPISFSNPFEKLYEKYEKEVNKIKETDNDKIENNIINDEITKPIDQTQEIEREKVIQEVEEIKEPNISSFNSKNINRPSKTTKSKNSIRSKLKNKKGLKEAIVLKEILDRKY